MADDSFIAPNTRKATTPSCEVPARPRAWTSLAQTERVATDRDAAIRDAYASGTFTPARIGTILLAVTMRQRAELRDVNGKGDVSKQDLTPSCAVFVVVIREGRVRGNQEGIQLIRGSFLIKTKIALLMVLFAPVAPGSDASVNALGGYKVGDSFRTVQRLAALRVNDGLAGRRVALVPIGPRSLRSRNHYDVSGSTVEKYCGNAARCERNEQGVLAVIRDQIFLTVTRIERKKGRNVWFGHHDEIIVFANSQQIVAGIEGEVDITDLSILIPQDKSAVDPDEVLYTPDLTVLERVSSDPNR